MKLGDDFRDLAPLAPKLDPERWARMVGAVEQAAAPELARRSRLADPGLLTLLSRWTRPAISAAALAAAAAAATITLGTPGGAVEIAPGVSDALGYPDELAAWVETGWTPSVEELVLAMEGTP